MSIYERAGRYPCPYCGARPSVECISSHGRPARVHHKDRLMLALDSRTAEPSRAELTG